MNCEVMQGVCQQVCSGACTEHNVTARVHAHMDCTLTAVWRQDQTMT